MFGTITCKSWIFPTGSLLMSLQVSFHLSCLVTSLLLCGYVGPLYDWSLLATEMPASLQCFIIICCQSADCLTVAYGIGHLLKRQDYFITLPFLCNWQSILHQLSLGVFFCFALHLVLHIHNCCSEPVALFGTLISSCEYAIFTSGTKCSLHCYS